MNRSYSKIRHIRESNIRLEKRLITEGEESVNQAEMSQVNTELSSAGLPQISMTQVLGLIERDENIIKGLTQSVQKEVEAPTTQVNPEEVNTAKQKGMDYVCSVLESKGKAGLWTIIKELLRLKKEKKSEKKMNEQAAAGAALIFGLNPLTFWVVFGSILVFALALYFGHFAKQRYGGGCDRRGFIGY
jgi:hypothetical protein